MKTKFAAIAAILVLIPLAQSASAEEVPPWIKTNAGWWADGTISESEFVSGIQFLIKDGILAIPPTNVSAQTSEGVPEWVKTNAAWWAAGTISDGEFVNGIQHLIKTGIVSVDSNESDAHMTAMSNDDVVSTSPTMESDSQLTALQAELEACQEIKRAYDRLNCEDSATLNIKVYEHKKSATPYQVGPATFYYMGADSEGNSLEMKDAGKATLHVRMLVVNNNNNENLSMFCSGPSVCNYDITDGSKAFKYSSTDFTSGNLVIKPGMAAEFNMMFGPNIGYGGTEFMYDPSKSYSMRISEPWGSATIPLGLG